jgi:hypothetical protein
MELNINSLLYVVFYMEFSTGQGAGQRMSHPGTMLPQSVGGILTAGAGLSQLQDFQWLAHW